jgi:acyl-CoA dehydrogenase
VGENERSPDIAVTVAAAGTREGIVAWDFETDPEYAAKLEWARAFVDEEVLPLEVLELPDEGLVKAIRPLQEEVKRQGLWAAHLPPELGGMGFGQVRLGLLHEILGRCYLAPVVFGNNAPDSGNAELLAVGIEQSGREDHRQQWLQPLLDGKLRSAFSMTEPGAGADPTLIKTSAVRDGEEWVINGHKWFTSNGSVADFLIVMCVTNPDVHPYVGCSMIVVPTDTPGVDIVRDVPTMEHPFPSFGRFGGHSEVIYHDVRVPAENLVGNEGEGFRLAQMRLGPGRIHHCMRWLGQSQRAFDMLCERAVSRYLHGSVLADKQFTQGWVADSMAEMQAARLMTLHAAWKMDKEGAPAARVEIAMIKYFGAQVLYNVIDRAIQAHGSLGFSTDMPLEHMYRAARAARIYDGPDEVHKVTVARQVLKRYEPADIPSEHVPTRREAAAKKFADLLAEVSSND